MTPKRIEYDPHAVRRMRQRGITRQDVRAILARGLREPDRSRLPGDPAFSRRLYIRRRRGYRPGHGPAFREARVLYRENAERLYVFVVEWVGDPKGLYDRG